MTLHFAGEYNILMRKIALISFLLFSTVLAQTGDLPKPRGYVNDFAGMIDSQSAQQISALCAAIDRSVGVQIAVVTIPSLQGASLEEEGLRYLEGWGVGKKGEDKGVVILVARDEKKIRIEVGYGLEGDIPDGKAGSIIRYVITPQFKEGDYGGGLLAAVYKIGQIEGADMSAYPQQKRRNRSNIGGLVYLVFFLILIISSMFGRRRGSRLGLLWFLTGFGMGFGGGRGGWGGGSGGSGGFGGFGGFGGGMGGGGGASGGW